MAKRLAVCLWIFLISICTTDVLAQAAAPAAAPEPATAPPPRTIADILAILDQEKPDPARRARQLAEADQPPPATADKRALAQFHYLRAQARLQIGRQEAGLDDLRTALPLATEMGMPVAFRIAQAKALAERQSGDQPEALKTLFSLAKEIETNRRGIGRLFNVYRSIGQVYIDLGQVEQAEKYVAASAQVMKDIVSSQRGGNNDFYQLGSGWQQDIDLLKALVATARGRPEEAIAHSQSALANGTDNIAKAKHNTAPDAPPIAAVELGLEFTRRSLGMAKLEAGRLVEAEVDIRTALLNTLRRVGKYHQNTALIASSLALVLVEEGRLSEAEALSRAATDIFTELGVDEASHTVNLAHRNVGTVLMLQRRWQEASESFERAVNATAGWSERRAAPLRRSPGRMLTLARAGNAELAVEQALSAVKNRTERVGPKHFDTALSQAILGIAYSATGRDAEAVAAFREAIPILTSSSRQADTEEGTSALKDFFVQNAIETYIVTLARSQGSGAVAGLDVGAESFRLADAARGRSVQRALSASAARSAVRDPALAALVRQEQDEQKAIAAQFGTLSSMLALPPDQRDDKLVLSLRTAVDKLRDQRAKTRQDIEKRFPEYASLIDPRPPSVDDLRAVLRPGEALLSFYLARENSFVWAVPKQGPVAFAAVPMGADELERRISGLRKALEPQAETLGDIPPFDLAGAHELYRLLLQPVEAGWKPAQSLYVVTNGALGLLPLSLLPTEPATVAAAGEPLFAGYAKVQWLARSHAVTQLPSSAALKTLRGLPKGAPSRQPLIGFGDPFFNTEQAAEADEGEVKIASSDPVAVRGAKLKRRNAPQTSGVDSAELAQLPRLPDTSAELTSVAAAMRADAAKSLFLGKQANESVVKKADLAGYRVVAFATHGLVPGEINGLTQPALALSAPLVAGVEGDGLLTMDEILGLKLDADWVVLSACNTGAGAGAGAEAASGLGRAFFYAGTRALLLTNWSVHSASARDLVTDLFRRQAEDAGLSRAEALRRSMVALLDGPGYQEDGKTLFSYAHPIFWAPYSLMGDGG